jgi:hypothetical protein
MENNKLSKLDLQVLSDSTHGKSRIAHDSTLLPCKGVSGVSREVMTMDPEQIATSK